MTSERSVVEPEMIYNRPTRVLRNYVTVYVATFVTLADADIPKGVLEENETKELSISHQ